MRLDGEQAWFIHRQFRDKFGVSATVWLFGSRLDDSRKGGDVDLYVEVAEHSLFDELRCKIELEESLEIPVDLIVRRPDDNSPIALIAKRLGQRL
jgi:predicted nucleotidyltransferase